MSCATDELLAAWAAGKVGGAERDSLDEHAAGCALCRGVMLALAGVTHTAAAATVEGDMIGRFQAIRRGTTTILARDPSTENEVALRVVPATTETVREAQALSRLQHANLVRVLNVDIEGDDLIVATEVVDGIPFAEWLTRPRAPRARAKVLLSIGRALHVLHAHRITHGAFTKDSILVRRDGSGVLVGPAFGSTAKEDQRAWWLVVSETLGRPRSLRHPLAKGLAEDPSQRFPSMDAAVLVLRNRTGGSYLRWIAIGLVGFFALGVIGALTSSSRGLTSLAKTKCPATATHDWRAMRLPVIAKLGAAGADTARVIARLDERTLRASRLQRETCSNATEQLCVDAVWQEHTALFPELIDRDPEVTRAAVDELVRLPSPDRCMHGMTGPKYAPLRARMLHVELANVPASARLQQLIELKDEVEALRDDGVAARWHLAIGVASLEADDVPAARSELESAANAAKLSGDVDTFVRALSFEVRISPNDSTLERRADAAAETLANPALSAELANAEAFVRSGADDQLAYAREAKKQWDAAAIDAHAIVVETDWLLADALRTQGAPDEAAPIYDEAYRVALKRFGNAKRVTLLIRAARANNELDRRHYDKARTELGAVASAFEHMYGVNEDVVTVRNDLCECDLSASLPSTTCDAALAAAVEAFGDHSLRLLQSIDLVAQERLLTHDDAGAAAACERALLLLPDDNPTIEAHLAIALHRLHRTPARVRALAASAHKGLPSDSLILEGLDAELK